MWEPQSLAILWTSTVCTMIILPFMWFSILQILPRVIDCMHFCSFRFLIRKFTLFLQKSFENILCLFAKLLISRSNELWHPEFTSRCTYSVAFSERQGSLSNSQVPALAPPQVSYLKSTLILSRYSCSNKRSLNLRHSDYNYQFVSYFLYACHLPNNNLVKI
jgi:hypothetical protein